MMKADGSESVAYNVANDENPSGIWPTEFKVVVEPIKVDEKSKGGIILPDETKDRDQYAQAEGILVAVSPHAFSYADNWPPGTKPKPGDRVIFAQYAGPRPRKGKDGKEYRIINDKDVLAVLT